MRYGFSCQAAAFGTGFLLLACLGCRGKKEQIPPAGRATSAMMAGKAAAIISSVCDRQSYATASVGLIAGETKLREDVFELRDPKTSDIIPYRLDATLLLEDLLRHQAQSIGSHSQQADCMREFADHLKQLTDPLVQEAQTQKEIDFSAYKNAEKEAQQEMEMQQKMDQSK
ncbi:MAG TPA: hypothetical protein VFE38_02840 [Edaphobacter sp.]|nr:hypothetical protein [Edaphobacter sp.]